MSSLCVNGPSRFRNGVACGSILDLSLRRHIYVHLSYIPVS